MKETRLCAAILLALVALVILAFAVTGCKMAGEASGYFYLQSNPGGYTVDMDTDAGNITVSKTLPLDKAKPLCDKLNADLGDNSTISR